MPTPTTAKLAKPKSEDEFEDISVDFVRIRWGDPHASRNGRRGQRQHGVDIIGRPSWLKGRVAGAQCKNTDSLTLGDIIAAAKLAEPFPDGIGEFLLVSSAERDGGLQAAVRSHFASHPAPFSVELAFWPDITADIAQNETLVRKHWPGFVHERLVPVPVSLSGGDTTRDLLLEARAEVERIGQYADLLNRALYNRWHDQVLNQRFRAEALDGLRRRLVTKLPVDKILANALNHVCAGAVATDREIERYTSSTSDLTPIHNAVRLVNENYGHALRGIDAHLART